MTARGVQTALRQDGGVTAELAVLTPALVLLLLFVVFGGRLGQAEQDVTHATAEAARVASLGRGDVAALTRATVVDNLAATGVTCHTLQVTIEGNPPRAGGTVTVTTRCALDMTDVAGLGLPRRRMVSASAVEVVDTYRGNGRGFGISEGSGGANSGLGGG
jgi:Flp pilus assembly protein TadG